MDTVPEISLSDSLGLKSDQFGWLSATNLSSCLIARTQLPSQLEHVRIESALAPDSIASDQVSVGSAHSPEPVTLDHHHCLDGVSAEGE